jgi:flagellar basal-body rod protein FlgF
MTDRIFEIGEAGLESSDQKVRKLMDNMVNSRVPGYKKSDVVVRSFPLELQSATQRISAMKPQVEGSFYSNIQGALIKTDGKLDFAIGDEGYFVLSAPWGDAYTRDGRFHLDSEGRIVSVAGNLPLMGRQGPIILPFGSEVEVTQSGAVIVDGTEIDRILVVTPENREALESINGSVFKKKDLYSVMSENENPRVIQGYVEASNVKVIDQMMEMIYLERMYNLNTKMLQTRDANLARSMELGRPTQ